MKSSDLNFGIARVCSPRTHAPRTRKPTCKPSAVIRGEEKENDDEDGEMVDVP